MRAVDDTLPSAAFSLRLVPLLSTVLATICAAQETPDIAASWDCERCVAPDTWSLDLRAGPGLSLDDAFRFGDITGVYESGAYVFSDLLGNYRDAAGRFASIEAFSRGTGAFGIFTEGGKQGVYTARGSVQSIPRHFFDTTMTPFREADGPLLVLPPDWVRASTTSAMTALQSAAVSAPVAFDRRVYRIGLDVEPHSDLRLSIDYKHQLRDGDVRSSGAILFSALEFRSPIDYTTDDVEVRLDYSGTNWTLGASYFNSVFRNSNDSISWENPYSPIQGASLGRQSLPPDNDAQRISIAGQLSLPARTSIAGSLSIGRLRQDSALLPFTTNTSLSAAPLPATHADASADTTSFNLRATSSPMSKVTLSGDLELREFDNDTPSRIYDYIVTDALTAARPAAGTAYDFDKHAVGLRAEYRQSSAIRLEVGTELDRVERSAQARRRTDTRRIWVSARTRAGAMNEQFFRLFDERRDGSSYEQILTSATPENPLMRKYHLADRDRSGAEFRSTFVTGERSDFGFEIEISADRYSDTPVGLTDTDYTRIGADYSLLYSARTTLYVNVYKERFETEQSNSQSYGAADWSGVVDDVFDTATIGSTMTELFGAVDLELEAGWSRSVGRIGLDVSDAESTLPDNRSDSRYLRIALAYPYNEKIDVRAEYYYESLDTNDRALDGVGPATAPALLSSGAAAWQYRANVLFFSVAWSMAR